MYPQTLDTERLLLRKPQAPDLGNFHQVLANPAVSVWLGKPEGFTLGQSKDMLDRIIAYWESIGYGPWVLFEKLTGKYLGYGGLRFTEKLQQTELMYAISQDFWGKGLTTELGQKALEVGRETLNLSEVIAYTLPDNKASRRVMEKLGMTYIKDFVHADLLHVFYSAKFG